MKPTEAIQPTYVVTGQTERWPFRSGLVAAAGSRLPAGAPARRMPGRCVRTPGSLYAICVPPATEAVAREGLWRSW
jgi:hypothetical protein